MKIAIFQHEREENPGFLEHIFLEHNVPFGVIPLYDTGEVPRTDATHLVFLGGAMSVNDEREYPFLKQEKKIIRSAEKNGQKVLGICLGAQLIASAFGAPVYKYITENGWHDLTTVRGSPGIFARFPERFTVFQFHGETFAVPYGGRLLFTGTRVRNQGFFIGKCLGLQFHLEMTGDLIRAWSRSLKQYHREKIARDTSRFLSGSNQLCRIIAEDFIRT